MHDLIQDIRYALRTIAKNPGFAAVVILTLGLGIGVNTTVFISAEAVVFRPFPYEDPSRIVAVRSVDTRNGEVGGPFSYPDFEDLRQKAASFTSLAAYDDNPYNLAAEGAEPERVEGAAVSATLFPLLGINPSLGRNFREDEDTPAGERVVMLGHALWQNRFHADPGVVGRSVLLNGVSHTVVGVMPADFAFPTNEQLWTPMRRSAATEDRGAHFMSVIGRLKPGVTIASARLELASLMRQLELQYPASNLNFSATAADARKESVGDVAPVIFIMMGAVGFVLLIACANVANLMLARATSRHREVAIRTALGASRARIVRQLLTESVILALAGAVLGLLVALWGNDLINKAVPSDRPFWMKFEVDYRVLLFTAAIAVATGLLFGLAPALQASRADVGETLKESGLAAGTSRRRGRMRNVLVIAEVALSLVLLVGAGLMTRSFMALQNADPGFDRSHLLAVRASLVGPSYDSSAQRSAFLGDMVARLQGLPGVKQVAATSFVPLTRSQSITVIQPEGKTYPQGERPLISIRSTFGDMAGVMRIPILRGRGLTVRDAQDTTRAVLINETMAKRIWAGEDAVGKRFIMAGDTSNTFYTVAGVAADIRARRLTDAPENQVYFPYTDWEFRGMTFLIRTDADPMSLAPAVRDAIHARDASLPLYDVSSMDAVFARSFWERRLYGVMFASFGAIALLLAAIGLYAVIAYGVAQRTREIGVRMALGAASGDVVRMVVGRGAALAGIGLAIGTAGALALTSVLRGMLYNVSPRDPAVFAVVAGILGAVALLASALPARRAARVDPMHALRND